MLVYTQSSRLWLRCDVSPCLQFTAVDNRGRLAVFDIAGAAASGLDRFDDPFTFFIFVHDLAEDDVLAIEPAGHNGGDEELRPIAFPQTSVYRPEGRLATHVFGPALAMESIKGFSCFSEKFSSANFSP